VANVKDRGGVGTVSLEDPGWETFGQVDKVVSLVTTGSQRFLPEPERREQKGRTSAVD
jgi:hypothetical protein